MEILKAARERITPKEAWTTGEDARDEFGGPVLPDDPDAVSWCMAGAVMAEGVDATTCGEIGPIGRLLNQATGVTGVGPWNDSHSHDEVLAALDRAIELAEVAA